MKQTDSAFKPGIFQVGIKLRQVMGHNQALVRCCQVGHGSYVELLIRLNQIHVLSCGHTPGHEKPPLKIVGGPARGCVDKHLFNARHGFQGSWTANRWIGRNYAPARYAQCFIFDMFFEYLTRPCGNHRIRVQKHHADTEYPAQAYTCFLCNLPEK